MKKSGHKKGVMNEHNSEMRVLVKKMSKSGMTRIQIADKLGLDYMTVARYISSKSNEIYCKCGEPAVSSLKGEHVCRSCMCPDYKPEYKSWRTSSPSAWF